MKTSVGVLLVTYGTFWTGEGLKITWRAMTDAVCVCVLYAVVTWLLIQLMRRAHPNGRLGGLVVATRSSLPVRLLKGFAMSGGISWWG